jgi:hypothetical protein
MNTFDQRLVASPYEFFGNDVNSIANYEKYKKDHSFDSKG